MQKWIIILALLFLVGCKGATEAPVAQEPAVQETPSAEVPADSIDQAIGEAGEVDSIIDPQSEEELDNLDDFLNKI